MTMDRYYNLAINKDDVYLAVGRQIASLLLSPNKEAYCQPCFCSSSESLLYSEVSDFSKNTEEEFIKEHLSFLDLEQSHSTCTSNRSDVELSDEELAIAFLPRAPPADYVCDLCFKPGHYIKYCPLALSPTRNSKTPYQGPLQSEGDFHCNKCKHRWVSQKSFANKTQKCKKCGNNVFPKKQRKRMDSMASSFSPSPSSSPGMNMNGDFEFF